MLLSKGLGTGPLLLITLVGLADGLGCVQSGLLLSLLGEVGLKGDLLDLWLLVLSLGILSLGVLLLGLGNGLSGLLVLELSLTLLGTPCLGSLLLGAARISLSVRVEKYMTGTITYGATFLECRSSALRW